MITIGPVEAELEAECLCSQQRARDCRVGIAEVIDGRVDERTASDVPQEMRMNQTRLAGQ